MPMRSVAWRGVARQLTVRRQLAFFYETTASRVLSRLMKLAWQRREQQRVTGFRIHRSIRISIIRAPIY